MEATVSSPHQRAAIKPFRVRAFLVGDVRMSESSLRQSAGSYVDLQVVSLRPRDLIGQTQLEIAPGDAESWLTHLLARVQAAMPELPCFRSWVVRYLEPADLVVVALDGTQESIEIAGRLRSVIGIFGIDTMVLSTRELDEPLLGTCHSGFGTLLKPAMSGAPCCTELLGPLLAAAFTDGLVCVDWDDMTQLFFDRSRVATWATANAKTTKAGLFNLRALLGHCLSAGVPDALMAIIKCDASFRMTDLRRTLTELRQLLNHPIDILTCAPYGMRADAPVLTILAGYR